MRMCVVRRSGKAFTDSAQRECPADTALRRGSVILLRDSMIPPPRIPAFVNYDRLPGCHRPLRICEIQRRSARAHVHYLTRRILLAVCVFAPLQPIGNGNSSAIQFSRTALIWSEYNARLSRPAPRRGDCASFHCPRRTRHRRRRRAARRCAGPGAGPMYKT